MKASCLNLKLCGDRTVKFNGLLSRQSLCLVFVLLSIMLSESERIETIDLHVLDIENDGNNNQIALMRQRTKRLA